MFRSVFSIPPLPAKLFPASTTGYSNGLFISKNQFFENFYFFCFLSFSIIRRTKRRRRRMKQGEGWKALEEIFLDSVTFSSGKTSNFRGETAKLPRVAFSRIFLAPISLEKISKREGGGCVRFEVIFEGSLLPHPRVSNLFPSLFIFAESWFASCETCTR